MTKANTIVRIPVHDGDHIETSARADDIHYPEPAPSRTSIERNAVKNALAAFFYSPDRPDRRFHRPGHVLNALLNNDDYQRLCSANCFRSGTESEVVTVPISTDRAIKVITHAADFGASPATLHLEDIAADRTRLALLRNIALSNDMTIVQTLRDAIDSYLCTVASDAPTAIFGPDCEVCE